MRLRALFLSLLVVGCTKSDPAPIPTADFTKSRSVLETGEQLQLTNTSQHAVRYEWRSSHEPDLVKTEPNPTYMIRTPGWHSITLVAFNADKVTSTATQTVKVGNRRIKWYRITSIDFARPDGQPWYSAGTGPTVTTTLVRSTGTTAFSTKNINVSPAGLPLRYGADNSLSPLFDGSYSIQFATTDRDGNPEPMFTLPLVISGPPADRNAEGIGTYRFQSGKWAVELEIETR